MLLSLDNLQKSIGNKVLYEDLSFKIEEGEKVGLIGRNGLGKTTLFKMITGDDKDFKGEIWKKKDLRIVMTKQEHTDLDSNLTVLDYVLNDIPNFRELEKLIRINTEDLGEDMEKITAYSDAIEEFSRLGYYQIEEQVIETLDDFGINMDKALNPLKDLSGGQKRFVELTRVMYSKADIALIDEPTNHMDFAGKEDFIKWLLNTEITLLVITHDRDVLKHVNRILEIRDKKIQSFKGNYDAYIKQNSLSTVTSITEYENNLKTLEKLHKQVEAFKAKRTYGPAMRIMYERFQRDYDELKEKIEKPSFWIDENSVDQMSDKVVEKYESYKDRNIKINANSDKEHKKELMKVLNLSLGYTHPLFKNLHFTLLHGDRLFIKGRNGAGKTTLVKTIINEVEKQINFNHESINQNEKFAVNIYNGEIKPHSSLRIGLYQQEIDEKYLDHTLGDAILTIYHDQKLEITIQKVKSIMSQYLFNPMNDWDMKIANLSGGQKARFQIIKMLSNKPNLLILDEPTNHLDLPSIEELENSLINFSGAILYISHDSYFINKLQGEVIHI